LVLPKITIIFLLLINSAFREEVLRVRHRANIKFLVTILLLTGSFTD